MLVRTISYVYPGVNKSGVSVVEVRDEAVKSVAVGSVDNTSLSGLLELVRPTEMVVAVNKFYRNEHTNVPVPDTVTKFTIARPGWERVAIPLVIEGKRQHGVYAHNVFKIMFHDVMRRGVTIRNFKVNKFDREWVLQR